MIGDEEAPRRTGWEGLDWEGHNGGLTGRDHPRKQVTGRMEGTLWKELAWKSWLRGLAEKTEGH